MRRLLVNRKILRSTLSIVYMAMNVVFVHSAESRFWADRRKARAEATWQARLPDRSALETAWPRVAPVDAAVAPTARARRLPERLSAEHRRWLAALPESRVSLRRVALPAGVPRGLVIHLQDVHHNVEAQRNLGDALTAVLSVAGDRLPAVALEGAFGPLRLERSRSFPDRDALRVASEEMLRQSEISGPVHALINAPGPTPVVVGVDDPDHYTANAEAYREAHPRLPAEKDRLARRRAELESAKRATYHPALLAFDQKTRAYHEGKDRLGEYARALSQPAPTKHPALAAFLETLAMEESLDYARVEAERARVLEALGRALPADALEKLVAAGIALRSGEWGTADFYASLKDFCREASVDLDRAPAFAAYVRYVLRAQAIDADRLFDEMRAREEELYNRLVTTSAERRLWEESTRLGLEEKLANFSLTPDEWASLQKHGPARSPVLALGARFYAEAHARDAAMADRLLADLADRPGAVLVTGGYHARGMTDRLLRAGYAVASAVPKLTRVESPGGADYLSVFAREKTPLDKLFEGPALFLATPPASEKGLARTELTAAAVSVEGSPEGTLPDPVRKHLGAKFTVIDGGRVKGVATVRVRRRGRTIFASFDPTRPGGHRARWGLIGRARWTAADLRRWTGQWPAVMRRWLRGARGAPASVEILRAGPLRRLDPKAVFIDFDLTIWAGYPFEAQAAYFVDRLFNGDADRLGPMTRLLKRVSGLGEAEKIAVFRADRTLGFPVMDDAGWTAIYREVRQQVKKNIEERFDPRLVPGVLEFLREVAASGRPVYVLTGGNAEECRARAERLGVAPFLSGYFGDGDKAKRLGAVLKEKNLAPTEVLFIGDAPSDMEAARFNGVLGVGLALDRNDEPVLKDAGAGVLVRRAFSDPEGLLTVLNMAPPPAIFPARAGLRTSVGTYAPLFQLRSERDWGIGDFGTATDVVDLHKALGLTLMQIEPLNLSSAGNSPYSVASSRALEPNRIDVEAAVALWAPQGETAAWIAEPDTQQRIAALRGSPRVRYGEVDALKREALGRLWREIRNDPRARAALAAFRQETSGWILDHLLYVVLKRNFLATGGVDERGRPLWDWRNWPAGLRDREEGALRRARIQHREEIAFELFLQFLAADQRRQFVHRARRRGVEIMVDIPFALDGADLWIHPEVFGLRRNEGYRRKVTQGVPPEPAYPAGQYWQFYPFDWAHPASARFIEDLLRFNQQWASCVRLDHVLGYYRAYLFSEDGDGRLTLEKLGLHRALRELQEKGRAGGDDTKREAVTAAALLIKENIQRLASRPSTDTPLPPVLRSALFGPDGAWTPDAAVMVARAADGNPPGGSWARQYVVEQAVFAGRPHWDFLRLTPRSDGGDGGFLWEYLFGAGGEVRPTDSLRPAAFVRGPGEEILAGLLATAQAQGTQLVWETLGTVPAGVPESVRRLGGTDYIPVIYGENPHSLYHPSRHGANAYVTLGLHDSTTLRHRWENEWSEGDRRHLWGLARPDRAPPSDLRAFTPEVRDALISLVMKSPARIAALTWTDLLGLGEEHRINAPGVQDGQWTGRWPDTVEEMARALGPGGARHPARDPLLALPRLMADGGRGKAEPSPGLLRTDPETDGEMLQLRPVGRPFVIDAFVYKAESPPRGQIFDDNGGAVADFFLSPVDVADGGGTPPGVTQWRALWTARHSGDYTFTVTSNGHTSPPGRLRAFSPGTDLNPLSPEYGKSKAARVVPWARRVGAGLVGLVLLLGTALPTGATERPLYSGGGWSVLGAEDTGPAARPIQTPEGGFSELKVMHNDVQIGSVKGNGYYRLAPSGTVWGTSFVTPSYWAEGRRHVSALTDLSFSFDESGRLRLTGKIDAPHWYADDFTLTFLVSNPREKIEARVSYSLRAKKDFAFDRERIENGEALKWAQFSSMNIGTDWDAEGVLHPQGAAVFPRAGGWVFARSMALGSGQTLQLTNDQVDRPRETPTTYLRMESGEIPFVAQGWVTPSNDPNDDNVGVWVSPSVPPAPRAGEMILPRVSIVVGARPPQTQRRSTAPAATIPLDKASTLGEGGSWIPSDWEWRGLPLGRWYALYVAGALEGAGLLYAVARLSAAASDVLLPGIPPSVWLAAATAFGTGGLAWVLFRYLHWPFHRDALRGAAVHRLGIVLFLAGLFAGFPVIDPWVGNELFYVLLVLVSAHHYVENVEAMGGVSPAARWATRWLRDVPPNPLILSLGSNGIDETHFLMSRPDARLRGLTVSREDLGRAGERARSAGVDARAFYALQDMRKGLPAEDASVVLVHARLSLHYLNRIEAAEVFGEIRRVLAPGGRAIIVVKSDRDFWARHPSARHDPESDLTTYLEPRDAGSRPVRRRFFSASTLRADLAAAGLVPEGKIRRSREVLYDDRHASDLLTVVVGASGVAPGSTGFRFDGDRVRDTDQKLSQSAHGISWQVGMPFEGALQERLIAWIEAASHILGGPVQSYAGHTHITLANLLMKPEGPVTAADVAALDVKGIQDALAGPSEGRVRFERVRVNPDGFVVLEGSLTGPLVAVREKFQRMGYSHYGADKVHVTLLHAPAATLRGLSQDQTQKLLNWAEEQTARLQQDPLTLTISAAGFVFFQTYGGADSLARSDPPLPLSGEMDAAEELRRLFGRAEEARARAAESIEPLRRLAAASPAGWGSWQILPANEKAVLHAYVESFGREINQFELKARVGRVDDWGGPWRDTREIPMTDPQKGAYWRNGEAFFSTRLQLPPGTYEYEFLLRRAPGEPWIKEKGGERTHRLWVQEAGARLALRQKYIPVRNGQGTTWQARRLSVRVAAALLSAEGPRSAGLFLQGLKDIVYFAVENTQQHGRPDVEATLDAWLDGDRLAVEVRNATDLPLPPEIDGEFTAASPNHRVPKERRGPGSRHGDAVARIKTLIGRLYPNPEIAAVLGPRVRWSWRRDNATGEIVFRLSLPMPPAAPTAPRGPVPLDRVDILPFSPDNVRRYEADLLAMERGRPGAWRTLSRFLEDTRAATGTPLEGKWDFSFLAVVDGHAVGYLIGLRPNVDKPYAREDLVLRGLTVDKGLVIFRAGVMERARGHGVGRRLWRAAAEKAQAEGVEYIYQDARVDNVRARDLYRRLGFVDLSEFTDTSKDVDYMAMVASVDDLLAATGKPAGTGFAKTLAAWSGFAIAAHWVEQYLSWVGGILWARPPTAGGPPADRVARGTALAAEIDRALSTGRYDRLSKLAADLRREWTVLGSGPKGLRALWWESLESAELAAAQLAPEAARRSRDARAVSEMFETAERALLGGELDRAASALDALSSVRPGLLTKEASYHQLLRLALSAGRDEPGALAHFTQTVALRLADGLLGWTEESFFARWLKSRGEAADGFSDDPLVMSALTENPGADPAALRRIIKDALATRQDLTEWAGRARRAGLDATEWQRWMARLRPLRESRVVEETSRKGRTAPGGFIAGAGVALLGNWVERYLSWMGGILWARPPARGADRTTNAIVNPGMDPLGRVAMVNLMDAGSRVEGGGFITERGLAKAARLFPLLARRGFQQVYLYNGLYALSPLGEIVHRDSGAEPRVFKSGPAQVRVEGYVPKREERGGLLYRDHGNNFSIHSMEILNPAVVDGADNEERWRRFAEVVTAARREGLGVVVDLNPWISPDALTPETALWAEEHRRVDGADRSLSDEALLAKPENADFALLTFGEERILVKNCFPGKDQMKPNPRHPDYFAYLERSLRRLIDAGVAGVRVDMAGDLTVSQIGVDWEVWGRLIENARRYAADKGQKIHFIMEAFKDNWPERFLERFPDNYVYHAAPFHIYRALARGDRAALPELRREMDDVLRRRKGQYVVYPTNFDEPSLKALGGPTASFAALLLTYERLGVPLLLDLRELMGEEGQNIPQAGGERRDEEGRFQHPFSNPPRKNWLVFRRRLEREDPLGVGSWAAELDAAQKVEILDTGEPARYFAVGLTGEDGSETIRVFDFYPDEPSRPIWIGAPRSIADKVASWGGTLLPHVRDPRRVVRRPGDRIDAPGRWRSTVTHGRRSYRLEDVRAAGGALLRIETDAQTTRRYDKSPYAFVRGLNSTYDRWGRDESEKVLVLYGAARLEEDSEAFVLCQNIGWAAARRGYIVRTGWGPGAMTAGPKGARRANGKTQGVHIDVKFEEARTPYIDPADGSDHLYFSDRKLALAHRMSVAVVAPGGIGTLDELVEALRQNHPIIFLDRKFWEAPFLELIRAVSPFEPPGFEERVRANVFFADTAEEGDRALNEIERQKIAGERPLMPKEAVDVDDTSMPRMMHQATKALDRLVGGWGDNAVLFVGGVGVDSPLRDAARGAALRLKESGLRPRAGGWDALNWLHGVSNGETQALLHRMPWEDFRDMPEGLPRGQRVVIEDGPVHRYLATLQNRGYVFLPGNLGKWNILMDLLVQMQTGKIPRRPIVLVDQAHWRPFIEAFFQKALPPNPYSSRGLVAIEDRDLIQMVDSSEEVLRALGAEPLSLPEDVDLRGVYQGVPVVESFVWMARDRSRPGAPDVPVFESEGSLSGLLKAVHWILSPNDESTKAEALNRALASGDLVEHAGRLIQKTVAGVPALAFVQTRVASILAEPAPGRLMTHRYDQWQRLVSLATQLEPLVPQRADFRTAMVNLMDVGSHLRDAKMATARGLAKAARLLPFLAKTGMTDVYVHNGLYRPSEAGIVVHTQSTAEPNLLRFGNATVYVQDYLPKSMTVSVDGRDVTLRDDFGNNYSVDDMDQLNPAVVDGDTNEDRWAHLAGFAAAARQRGMTVTVDLVPWIAPTALTFDRLAWARDVIKVEGDRAGLSDRALLETHRDYILMTFPQGRYLVRRYMGIDQIQPDFTNPHYFAYLESHLRRLIDAGVARVRVDMAHDLIDPARDPQWRLWTKLIGGAKAHAARRGQSFHFLMEAYGAWAVEFIKRFPEEQVYHVDPHHNYRRVAAGHDPRALPDLLAALNYARDQQKGRFTAFPTNFDMASLANLGGPTDAFLKLLLVYERLGVPLMIDLREMLGEEGQNIPQAGGQEVVNGNFGHPFLRVPRRGYRGLLRLIGALPTPSKTIQEWRELLRGAAAVEILESNDPSRFVTVRITNKEGWHRLEELDFAPQAGPPTADRWVRWSAGAARLAAVAAPAVGLVLVGTFLPGAAWAAEATVDSGVAETIALVALAWVGLSAIFVALVARAAGHGKRSEWVEAVHLSPMPWGKIVETFLTGAAWVHDGPTAVRFLRRAGEVLRTIGPDGLTAHERRRVHFAVQDLRERFAGARDRSLALEEFLKTFVRSGPPASPAWLELAAARDAALLAEAVRGSAINFETAFRLERRDLVYKLNEFLPFEGHLDIQSLDGRSGGIEFLTRLAPVLSQNDYRASFESVLRREWNRRPDALPPLDLQLHRLRQMALGQPTRTPLGPDALAQLDICDWNDRETAKDTVERLRALNARAETPVRLILAGADTATADYLRRLVGNDPHMAVLDRPVSDRGSLDLRVLGESYKRLTDRPGWDMRLALAVSVSEGLVSTLGVSALGTAPLPDVLRDAFVKFFEAMPLRPVDFNSQIRVLSLLAQNA